MPSTLQSPSKEQVRMYMQERQKSPAPPPSRERVREMLGFGMLEDERKPAKEVAR